MPTALMDGNPVALQLRSNYLSLSGDNGIHAGGDILDGNLATVSTPIAVQGLHGKAGKLKDGLPYRLAGDRAGMNAHASDHDGPVDDGDALAGLCRRDSALLACWATADHNKVIFGYIHLEAFDSQCHQHWLFDSARVQGFTSVFLLRCAGCGSNLSASI